MRENGREPGRGSLAAQHDATGHHAQSTVGKTTRVEQLFRGGAPGTADASGGPDAEAAKKQHTLAEVTKEFQDARAYAGYLYAEREHAIQDLAKKLDKHVEPIDKNILAHLAKVALGVAGKSIQAKVAKGLIKGAAYLVNHYLDDKSKDHVPESAQGTPAEAFTQMQLAGLDEGTLQIGLGINDAEEYVTTQRDAGTFDMNDSFRRAHSMSLSLSRHRQEAYQIQYNVSTEKWFSARAQRTFGREPGGASDIDGHLATAPVAPGNQNYARGYNGKEGFVHLALKLSYTHALGVEAFKTPGIDPSVWEFAREPKYPALGSIPLNALPGHQHLPVIADVEMILEAGSAGVKQHLPSRDEAGQNHQPVAVSWNERNHVETQLPTKDQFGADIQGDDRRWLSEQVGHAVGKKTADQAGNHIMRERVGRHSLSELAQAAKDKKKL